METVHRVIDLVFHHCWGLIRELESPALRMLKSAELTNSIDRLKEDIGAGKVTISRVPLHKETTSLIEQKTPSLHEWLALFQLHLI